MHSTKWDERCKILGITRKRATDTTSLDYVQNEAFTTTGFLNYLIRWIVTNDQSFNVVESDDFRRFVLYCARELKDDDIPHRTKTQESVLELFDKMSAIWIEEVKAAPGRVSFTTDLWTDPALNPFMSVTAHWIDESEDPWKVECRLIAFKHMPSSHTGKVLGDAFVDVLRHNGLMEKIGQITADNASNNASMMEEIEQTLIAAGIPFSRFENRIRCDFFTIILTHITHFLLASCFPHVINLAVQAFLDALSAATPTLGLNEDILKALQADPVKQCRDLVAAIRKSSQRREEFRNLVAGGKAIGAYTCDALELIRDMVVRWSSTYNMIDRFFTMIQPITDFAKTKELRQLEPAEMDILQDILAILELFHAVQELLSSERTPTLAVALPAYEEVLAALSGYIQEDSFPNLSHAISAAINKLDRYVKIARTNPVYAIAMFVNPSSKRTWMEKHWAEEDVQKATSMVISAMMEYRIEELTCQQPVSATSGSGAASSSSSRNPVLSSHERAAKNVQTGWKRLRTLSKKVSVSHSLQAPVLPPPSHPTRLSDDAVRDQARRDVTNELHAYLSLPAFEEGLPINQIVSFWQVSLGRFIYYHY